MIREDPRAPAGALNLLLVEDDEVDVLAVRRALLRAGLLASLVVAPNGAEALDWLRQGGWARTQAVVTDLDLPLLGGLRLIGEIRRDFTLRELDVIILTHRDDPETRAEAERLGVAAYLLKPPQPAALVEALRGKQRRP